MSNTSTYAVAVAPQQKQSALTVMAGRFSVEPQILLNTLKATVFKNATNEQLMALVVVANEYGLNPFTRQLYAFPDKGGGIVPVISVDGWLHMMNQHPLFDGIEYAFVENEKDGKPVSCTATLFVKNRGHHVAVTEYYAECHRNTDPWNKSPHRMLRHRATIQVIRVGFGFSAMDEDEAAALGLMQPKGAVASSVGDEPIFSTPNPVEKKATVVVDKPADNVPMGEAKAETSVGAPPVATEPATAAEKPAQNPPPTNTDDQKETNELVKEIEQLATAGGVTPAQVLAYCKKFKLAGKVCEELGQMMNAKLKLLISEWDNVLPKIKEA